MHEERQLASEAEGYRCRRPKRTPATSGVAGPPGRTAKFSFHHLFAHSWTPTCSPPTDYRGERQKYSQRSDQNPWGTPRGSRHTNTPRQIQYPRSNLVGSGKNEEELLTLIISISPGNSITVAWKKSISNMASFNYSTKAVGLRYPPNSRKA